MKTKDVTYAGTDSSVFIYFYGPNGQSGVPGHGEIELDNSGNDFQPGSIGVYEVDGELNGPITHIDLTLDGTDEWKPEWITIKDPKTGLLWKADFGGEPFSNRRVVKETTLINALPDASPTKMAREWKLAQAWLDTFGAGIIEVCKDAAGSYELLLPVLLQQLEKCDFPTKFVTIGGTANAGIFYAGSIEGGAVHRVQPNKMLGEKVAHYLTVARGWDVSVGASLGSVVAAWRCPTVEGLAGESYACHLSVQAGIGIVVSAIFSPSGNSPAGIQISVLAGPDVALSAGQMDPYTWIWPV
ncbi:PLAT/LH2 domain-containing protein [Massilia sp. SR12]